MSTETMKKGNKKKVSKALKQECNQFADCFWVEFFGAPKSEQIEGVRWYSGADAHRKLGLNAAHVEWIANKVYEFRKRSFKEIRNTL